jgi:hypothetical protein
VCDVVWVVVLCVPISSCDVVWRSQIVEDLRSTDLLNNEEKHLLYFRFVEGASKQYYIPLFVTAGVTDRALDSCAAAAYRFNAAQDALKKVEIEADLAKYFTDKLIRYVVVWLGTATAAVAVSD